MKKMHPVTTSNIGTKTNNLARIFDDRGTGDADLAANSKYQQLLIHYQNAEWDECNQLIDDLLEQYPDKQVLLDFKADIDVQRLLRKMSVNKSRSRIAKIVSSILTVFLLLGIGSIAVGYFTQQTVSAYEREAENYQALLEQARQENIVLLENQARSALQAGKPDVTLEIVRKIEALDPDYPALADLRSEADQLLDLIDLYDRAVAELTSENYDSALAIFKQIKLEAPLFRDVDYRISWIENHQHVQQLIADGESAYKQKKWQDAIQAYEQALTLDPSVNSPAIKDQMLYSYLNSIVETLSRKDHTIEELERSGTYYRKAIALIPQNRDYIAEREQLQSLSLELLVSKNYQTAKMLLSDPNHSRLNVTKAINFLKYASELKPDNQLYKSELSKAQLYQSILDAFDQGKMSQAIAGLEDLARFDRQYPNGMGPVLLYEAYVSQGLKLYEDGFYRDARINFEQAELVAWPYGQFIGWGAEKTIEAAGHIPPGVILQHNFETGGANKQLGKLRPTWDYWLSYVGPSDLFARAAEAARANGTRTGAKLQVTLVDRNWRDVGRVSGPANQRLDFSFPVEGLNGQVWLAQAAATRCFCSALRATTKCQGWRLAAEGACRPASRIASRSLSGSGSPL